MFFAIFRYMIENDDVKKLILRKIFVKVAEPMLLILRQLGGPLKIF